MDQFFSINIGQVAQVVTLLIGIGVMFQALRGDIKNQGERLVRVEGRLEKVEVVIVGQARTDERINAMDQRMLAQGARIDTQATLIGGRLEAINNIVAGHTAQLNNLPRKVG